MFTDRRAVKEASGRMVATKRVVKNPQPKLDVTRLTGERGLGQLRNMHPHIRLKGLHYWRPSSPRGIKDYRGTSSVADFSEYFFQTYRFHHT